MRMKLDCVPLIAALVVSASVAAAQTQSLPRSDEGRAAGGGTELATGSTNEGTQGQSNFVQKVATANQFEIQSSKLALRKTSDPAIMRFAELMIDEHGEAGDKLKSTLQSAGANMSPPEGIALDAKRSEVMHKLEAATGAEFDRLYLDAQRASHSETVTLLREYARSGSEAALRAFAEQTLVVVEKHLTHVQRMKSPS